MLASVGDLVEDVVVHLHAPVALGSDTPATVRRRRGGSAANVVAAACLAGGRARFVGQVGDDATGRWLTTDLAATGADVVVRRSGRTGTVIALVDQHGERTMLSDRGSAPELADPRPEWLDGIASLHVPFYSLTGEPLASTTRTMAAWAADRGIAVSVDVSSSAVLESYGVDAAVAAVQSLQPRVVLANEQEAAILGRHLAPAAFGAEFVVVKQGSGPVLVLGTAGQADVPAPRFAEVPDTTGAGDAFAAGLLLALEEGLDAPTACRHGHRVAADHLRRLGAR